MQNRTGSPSFHLGQGHGSEQFQSAFLPSFNQIPSVWESAPTLKSRQFSSHLSAEFMGNHSSSESQPLPHFSSLPLPQTPQHSLPPPTSFVQTPPRRPSQPQLTDFIPEQHPSNHTSLSTDSSLTDSSHPPARERNEETTSQAHSSNTSASKQKQPASGRSRSELVCTRPGCGKTFACRANLRIHQRVHTKERPFPCPMCDKAFSVKCTLKAHIHVHTGEKPYECSICCSRFRQSTHLKAHRRREHRTE